MRLGNPWEGSLLQASLGDNFCPVGPGIRLCARSANAAEEGDLPSPSLSALHLLSRGVSYPVRLPFCEVKTLLSPHCSLHCPAQAAETGDRGLWPSAFSMGSVVTWFVVGLEELAKSGTDKRTGTAWASLR